MRQEKFKMERQGLIHIGDEVEISEFQSYQDVIKIQNESSQHMES